MNQTQYLHQLGMVSPQAIETLKSLEQLQNLSQTKIVKRLTAASPIKSFILNGRQVTVFGNSPQPKVIIPMHQQGSFANQTDRISSSHARSISSEMQSFKKQVQENNILLQTIISKYESSPKLSIPMNNSGTQTPTMFNRNSSEDISQVREKNNIVKEYEIKSPQINLIQKKKLVLNQILQIDNQIKLLQDEEVKMKLDPSHQKASNDASFTHLPIKDQLEKQVGESSFMKKLSEWMKKKKGNTINQTEQQINSVQTSVLRDCTSKGNLTAKSKQTTIYERNTKWQKQKRINVKKNLPNQVKGQKSMIEINGSKSPNKIPGRPNSTELNFWIKGKGTRQSSSPKKSREKQSKVKQLLANKLRF